jgi:hypothetical protein
VSPRQGDVIVALIMVGVGIAGLVSGLLGHPTALSLAFAMQFALIPRFVRAFERESASQRMTVEPLGIFYRRRPWLVAIGVVAAVTFVIDATAHFGQEPGRAVVEVLAGASVLLAGIRLLVWTRPRT